MLYALLIYADESIVAGMSEDEREELMEGYREFNRQVAAAGVFRATAKLSPSELATTRRVRPGGVASTDGPFAETKEQLAGAYYLECDGLDAALAWADRIPGARIGSIEVRPIEWMRVGEV